jgi:hypothetical protein
MNDTNSKNSFCDYIYKKGDKKGLKCNIMNCILHVKNSKTVNLPVNLPVTPDKILIQLPKQPVPVQQPVQQQLPVQQAVISEIEKLIKNKLITADLASMKQKILDLETDIDNKTILMKHYLTLRKLDPTSTEYYKNQIVLFGNPLFYINAFF